jgi:hypothetical protein
MRLQKHYRLCSVFHDTIGLVSFEIESYRLVMSLMIRLVSHIQRKDPTSFTASIIDHGRPLAISGFGCSMMCSFSLV